MAALRPARVAALLVVGVAVIVGLLGSAAAGPERGVSAEAVAALQARAHGTLNAQFDAHYGNVSFFMGPMPYEAGANARGDALATAIEFLSQNPGLYRMTDPARELAHMRTTSDALGQVHVRLQQQVDGVPVFAHSLYVHLDASGKVIGTNGHYVPGITIGTTPGVRAETAAGIALADAASATAIVRQPALLVIYVDASYMPHLAWQVEVWDAGAPSRTVYFVEARGGAILHSIDVLEDAKYREVYDAQNEEQFPGVLIGREGELPRDDTGKMAYQNSGLTYDYYLNTHNRDSFDDRGSKMISTVHFGDHYDGAFWNGEQMVYGDGDQEVSKPYAYALDVAAHEMTHGVTQYTANMVYESQPGALNEHYSDFFACMIDRKDWKLGEDIWVLPDWPTKWLRDMEDPSLGGNYDPNDPMGSPGQPMNMSEYANLPAERRYDNGGVHINSGIPNYAAYLAATATSREVVEKIWYRTLTTYLTESSEFADFATGTLQSTEDLYSKTSDQYAAVQSALEQVGLGAGGPQPTPVPTATREQQHGTPVPPPTRQAGCTELVQNGGFENRETDPWVESTALEVAIVSEQLPRSGKKSAWLGGSDQEAFQYIYQDVQIPANAKSVTLYYWHFLHEEPAGPPEPARFTALLANTDGDIIATLEEFMSTEADNKWAQSTLDLKRHAGKLVRLAFTAEMVTGNISSFFVDDVSVQSCTSGAGAPTPTPKAEQGITVGGRITDYNTGDGISGATVWVMKEGLTASEAAADNRVTSDEVYTSGVTDSDGYYQLALPLKRGPTYSAIVIARGYYSIIADDALNTADWGDVTEVTNVNGEMQPAQ